MKIGIDGRFWNETGVGRYIRNLVENLQKIDDKNEYVLFILTKDFESVSQQITGKNFHFIKTSIHWHSLQEQLEFPKVLEKESLDLMHFSYFSIPISYHRPYIVTIHDLILHHFATGEATTLPQPLYFAKLQAYKYIIKKAARNATKIIAVSQATKKEITDHLGVAPEKITVTYEGVDQLVEQRAKTNGENKYGNYFLHIGNVYPHKNAKRLIDAFQIANLPKTKLVFAGKRDYFMTRLEEYVKERQVQDSVLFLGFVSDSELAVLYEKALATVVPSLMEGFGLPVLEAMANSCLVLASDIPSLREVAGESALFTAPLDTKSLAKSLQLIVTSPKEQFNHLLKSGKERTKEFTWEKMARETLTLYESSFSL